MLRLFGRRPRGKHNRFFYQPPLDPPPPELPPPKPPKPTPLPLLPQKPPPVDHHPVLWPPPDSFLYVLDKIQSSNKPNNPRMIINVILTVHLPITRPRIPIIEPVATPINPPNQMLLLLAINEAP